MAAGRSFKVAAAAAMVENFIEWRGIGVRFTYFFLCAMVAWGLHVFIISLQCVTGTYGFVGRRILRQIIPIHTIFDSNYNIIVCVSRTNMHRGMQVLIASSFAVKQ